MKHIKSYKLFESISSDIDEIMIELQDEGFVVEQSYWVRGARGGYLRSDEHGNQFYGPIATDTKIYLRIEVKNSTKEFTLSEVLPTFERLKDYLENFSSVKYTAKVKEPIKQKNVVFMLFERI